MSLFNEQRLDNSTFKLDVDRMRKGWYSDKYFTNIAQMLTLLSQSSYRYQGSASMLPQEFQGKELFPGDLEVEMQFFTRRPGATIAVGIDKALTMLKHCTGYWDGERFVDTSDHLKVWAVQDGLFPEGEWGSIEGITGLESTRTIPRFCNSRNSHTGYSNPVQPGGYQCVQYAHCRPWQTSNVFPGQIRCTRSSGCRWLRL